MAFSACIFRVHIYKNAWLLRSMRSGVGAIYMDETVNFAKFSMEYRLLNSGKRKAEMNMGIDEAIMLSGKPTLRFFGWEPPAVSVGYFQSVEKEINLDRCRELGIDVVRRLTGGGAVFHENELTYSLIVPEGSEFSRNIQESYGQICGIIVDGLKKLGLDAEFKPINDIIVNGKKVSGNAQTRRGGMILQHGTILLDVDVEKMFSLLRVSSEKIRDKMIAAAEDRVTSINQELGSTNSYEKVRDKIIESFQESDLHVTHAGSLHQRCRSHMRVLNEEPLSNEESEKSRELAESKYSSPAWVFMR
jgi:lipoate-protein ligase A